MGVMKQLLKAVQVDLIKSYLAKATLAVLRQI